MSEHVVVRGVPAKRVRLAILLAATMLAPTAAPAQPADPVLSGFQDPPMSARPRVWWHWLNGNVTKSGIALDLAWMKRVGLGGLQNFDANLSTPQIVDQRLVYMTPAWRDAFKYAAGLAQQDGLELAIAASAGWSETGGPWVKPADGMKKLVWSETIVPGRVPFHRRLPSPPTVTGPYQDLAESDELSSLTGTKPKAPPTFYGDVAVYAVPAEGGREVPQSMSANGSTVAVAQLSGADGGTGIDLPKRKSDDPIILTAVYGRPTTIRSVTLSLPSAAGTFGDAAYRPRLEASNDGKAWRRVADVPLGSVTTTTSFAAVTASQFRLVFLTNPVNVGLGSGFTPAPGLDFPGGLAFMGGSPTVKIAEFSLSSEAEVNRFQAKAGFSIERDYYALDADADPNAPSVRREDVINLTERMKPDGTLDWTPPAGRWRIIRLGYSLTGKTNHPATEEATGLEVDKYDGTAVRAYLDHYLEMYRQTVGPDLIGARGVRALVTDSIEVGASNWTPQLVDQFKRLRGYDPTPWLPVVTGTIIGSRAQSDAFLYDYRRTLADLIAKEHYGTVATVAHEHGLKVYGEALEGGRPSLGDDIDMRSYADFPMAALWAYSREAGPNPAYLADMKGASSVAHVMGQNIAAAESMTAALRPWAFAPSDLRRVVDLEFAYGINRPVIHTSVHQPTDDKLPGLSLLIFGQYFNRHETWAEMAKPWVDYMSRSSFMLQQGRDVADVAYFYGEESPIVAQSLDHYIRDVPRTSGYDFVNAAAVRNLLTVRDGAISSERGARYRVLYLGGTSSRMTLATLQGVARLVEAGATVIGRAPTGSPSLLDDQATYRDLVAKLWAGGSSTRFGKGTVIAGQDVDAALNAVGVKPDFQYTGGGDDRDLLFVHRQLSDGEVYYLSNRRNAARTTEARFRVTGKVPEIWRADTGIATPVSYRTEGTETVVPLAMDAEESFFVVFRRPARTPGAVVPTLKYRTVAKLDGSWSVSFQPDRGAPSSINLPKLASLSEQADPGVRYFSGVATYTKTFVIPTATNLSSYALDLGSVGDLAEVRLNGKLVGTAWHPPYRLDIGRSLRPGKNVIEVKVADLWVNRLVGDAQPGAKKVTWTAQPTYRKDAPLRPSGLIGPVTILGAQTSAPDLLKR